MDTITYIDGRLYLPLPDGLFVLQEFGKDDICRSKFTAGVWRPVAPSLLIINEKGNPIYEPLERELCKDFSDEERKAISDYVFKFHMISG